MSGTSGEILKVIADVVGRLEKADLPYMISGSIAANVYAEPRFTNDIDIVLQIGEQKLLWRKETQSEQQLNDIKRLIAQNETILDREHLKSWFRKLGLQEEMAGLL